MPISPSPWRALLPDHPLILAAVLALSAAVLHAAWNLAVKLSGDRLVTTWAMFLYGAAASAPILLFTGLPGSQVVPFLVASAAVHVVYIWLLTRAYDLGDFSMAYPVARGGGALLAALGGVLLLGDHLSLAAGAGIGVVLLGLLSLARLRSSGVALAAALGTAAMIGTYTIIDSNGARQADGIGYGLAVSIAAAGSLSAFCLASGRGPKLLPAMRSWRVAGGGVASAAAYTFVLVAVRHAPVGYVACLRESSVVLGALGAWWILHEPMARSRIVSSAMVAAGVALLVVAR